MKQTTLRGGIVGCGAVANTAHMPAWRAMKDAEIVTACDLREGAVRETAKRWRIPSIHTDFSRMLQREELNFVDICTVPPTHCRLAIQAMEAGLHVLVEKPMAVSISEADEMVSAAEEHGVKLCVVHNNLFSPVIQKAKTLVDTGAIGELIAVEIHLIDQRDKHLSKQDAWHHDLPGGIFGEYAPHPAYLALAFLGNIHSVRAVARKCSEFPWVTADELKVLLEGENGLGAFTVSCNSPTISLTIDVFGTERNLHIDNFTQIMTCTRHRSLGINDLVLDRLGLIMPVLTSAASGTVSRLKGQKRSRIGHKIIIQKFIESIRDNAVPPVSGEDGRKTTRLLAEVWKQIG